MVIADDENSDFVANRRGTESIVAEMVERRERMGVIAWFCCRWEQPKARIHQKNRKEIESGARCAFGRIESGFASCQVGQSEFKSGFLDVKHRFNVCLFGKGPPLVGPPAVKPVGAQSAFLQEFFVNWRSASGSRLYETQMSIKKRDSFGSQ